MARRPETAFTLVELLTTVGIVAILAALLLPVANNATLSGKQAISVQRLRDLQAANIQYAAEHEGQYVPHYASVPKADGTGTDFSPWFCNSELLSFIIPDSQAYWWGNSPKAICSGLVPHALSLTMPISFGANVDGLAYGPDAWGNWNPIPRRSTTFANASKLMAFAESQDWTVWESASSDYALPEKQTNGAVAYRYKKMANVAFFDGHVEQLSKTDIKGNKMLWEGISQ